MTATRITVTALLATLAALPAAAKVIVDRPNTAKVELKDMIDTDEGYFPHDTQREAFAKKLAAPELTNKLLKCAPIGRRYALAMIEGGKKSRVMVAHPDRKLSTCLEKALAGINEPGFTLILTISLAPPPDTSPGRNDPLETQ